MIEYFVYRTVVPYDVEPSSKKSRWDTGHYRYGYTRYIVWLHDTTTICVAVLFPTRYLVDVTLMLAFMAIEVVRSVLGWFWLEFG